MHLSTSHEAIMARLSQLAPEQQAEVQDFIAFLLSKNIRRGDTASAMAVSEAIAARYWDNDDDAAYDAL